MARQSHYEERKHHLLASIHYLSSQHGQPPTVRELAEGLGMGVATVHSYLRKMAGEDLITWQPRSHRSILLTQAGHQRVQRSSATLPF